MRTILFFTALLAPLPAAAQYLTPEDVLQRDQGQYYDVGNSPRDAQQNATRQEEVSRNRERPTLREPGATSSAASTNKSSAAAVPVLLPGPPVNPEPVTEPKPEPAVDPVTARWLRRLERQEQRRGSTPREEVLHSGALHSGAPLAGTGPAKTATMIVLGGAVAWTLYRSRKLRQFLDEQ